MDACPDELWSRPAKEMGFWYLAYHTLWLIDFDFSPAATTFRSPDFDIHEYELREQEPPFEHPYSKADLKDYLKRCRADCKQTIAALEEDDRTTRGCQRVEVTFLEQVLYQTRHVQHHAAQLNLLLRQETDDAPRWIRRAEDPLTSHP